MSEAVTATTPFETCGEEEWTLLAEARLWRLAARLVSDPHREPSPALDEVAEARAAARFLGEGRTAAAVGRLRTRLPRRAEAHRQEFLAVFGVVPAGGACPYGCEYGGDSDVFRRAHRLADLSGFYRAFGLEPEAGERPDHVFLQASFLWYLKERSLAAVRLRHGKARRELLADAFRKFFADHFGRWVPSFAEVLGQRAREVRSPYYEVVSDFLGAWCARERRSLGLPPSFGAAVFRLPPWSAEEDCGACPLPGLGGSA